MLATVIVSLTIAALFAAVVVNEVKKRKSGRGGCPCGGDCQRCGGCRM